MCFCILVCVYISGTMGDRITPSESSKDEQWRVKRVICLLGLNSSLWSPAALSSFFFVWMLSYFEGEEHFSRCLHAYILADAADCVSRMYRVSVVWVGHISARRTLRLTRILYVK